MTYCLIFLYFYIFSIAVVTIFVNQTMDSKDSADSMVETFAFN